MNNYQERILFVVTEDWYFFSHRMHLAVSAIKNGYKIGVLSKFSVHKNEMENAGIDTFEWNINRSSKNIFKEIKSIISIKNCIESFKPNIIHSVALKPVIYTSIICSLIKFNNRVFALAGLGSIFTSRKIKLKITLVFLRFILRVLLKGEKTILILQNPEDRFSLLQQNIVTEDCIRIIRGAGVDINEYKPFPIPKGVPIIGLPSRMLWSKGIKDFVFCAKLINKDKINARFVLIGNPDVENPDAVPLKNLKEWDNTGVVEWWGFKKNMAEVYNKSTIICLPTTYGEGLPKTLLEAASCGRPIITYDVPGCREIVKNGHNGYLLKPGDLNQLVNKIKSLIVDRNLCYKMGLNGREIVKNNFTEEKIAKQTFSVWKEIL